MRKPKPLRAALYTRFSTDKQSSTAAQVRVCRDIARRNGFHVVATFSDEAVSGGTAKRSGYQAMLTAARAKQFDVVVMEDFSRLWRSDAESAARRAEFIDLGIAVVSLDYDSRSESAGILGALHGAMAEQYLNEIGRRTYRSLLERAEKGAPAGGRAFGYRVDKGKRAIFEPEAKIVRQVFNWRADGWSALRIVRHLNEKGVPPPGAHWDRKRDTKSIWRTSGVAGDPKRGIGLLNNPLYRGDVIWNRFKWRRSAVDRKKRKPILKPRSEWVVVHDEKLRIVDERTWLQVQRLQTEDSPKRAAIRKGIKNSPWQSRPRYWLSGILACQSCRSHLTISGLDYICPTAFAGDCKNRLRIRKAAVENAVLDLLREHLLDPARLRAEAKRVEKLLREREAQEADEARRAVDGTELRRIEREMRDVSKLRISATAKEAALATLRADREALKVTPVKATSVARKMLARLPDFAKEFEKQIGAALRDAATAGDIEDARRATAQLIDGGKVYVRAGKEEARARVDFLGLGSFALRIAKVRQSHAPNGSGGLLPAGHAILKLRRRP